MIGRIRPVQLAAITCHLWIFVLSGPAAADEPDFAASGVYVGIGAAFGWDHFDTGRYDVDRDVAFGADLWVGYRFLSYLAAELQVEYLNGFDAESRYAGPIIPDIITGEAPGFGNSRSEIQAVTFTGNLKASLPHGRFQPNVLVGVGLGHIENELSSSLASGSRKMNETDLAARFGGGFAFHLTRRLALQVSSSYVLQSGDLDGYDYVSVVTGLQYQF